MIDTHAHISGEESDAYLERAKQAGLLAIINIATNTCELEKGLALSSENRMPAIYTAAASTPHDAAKECGDYIMRIVEALEQKRLVAVGETGLDYHYEHAPKNVQQKSFCRQIDLAIHYDMPIQIHCREAFSDLFAILDSYKSLRGVMLHCFTGTKEEAKEALDRGFYLSFSGIVTFKKSVILQEIVEYVPIAALLLETDSPYLAPQSHRGKKNEPSFIVETAHFVANKKNMSYDALVKATTSNAKNLFRL